MFETLVWANDGSELADSALPPKRFPLLASAMTPKGVVMHGWMNSWDWLWMTFMMIGWTVVLGAVVYAAVRLAQRPPNERNT